MIESTLMSILGLKLERIYLRVWAPEGELGWDYTDAELMMSFNVPQGTKCLKFSTSKEDNWTQEVVSCDDLLSSDTLIREDLQERIPKWWNCEIDDVIDYEVYDVTNDPRWVMFTGSVVSDVHLLVLDGFDNQYPTWDMVFGIEIVFFEGFVGTYVGPDGSTLSTSHFNSMSRAKSDISRIGEVRSYSLKRGWIRSE